jgi:hypothetical protein
LTYQNAQHLVHESVAERLYLLVQGTSDIANQADTDGTQTRFFVVLKSLVQEWRERFHVLQEVLLQGASDCTNSGEDDIWNTRLGRQGGENLEQSVHDAVCLGFDLAFEALHDGLYELEKNMDGTARSNTYQKDDSQARLHLFQSNSVLDANDLLL